MQNNQIVANFPPAQKHQVQDEEATNLLKSSKWGEIYSRIREALNQTNLGNLNDESFPYPTEIST